MSNTSNTEQIDEIEYTLDAQQCAQVSLYMYEQWQKAMEPPLLVYKTFPEWLLQVRLKGVER